MPQRETLAQREARLNDLAERLASLVGRGMTYQRARARLIAQQAAEGNPIETRGGSTLRAVEERARQMRLVAGREQARETFRRTTYYRRIAIMEERARDRERTGEQPIEYEPSRTLGVPPTRIEVTWEDPRTGGTRVSVVYLPLLAGVRDQFIAAAVAAAVSQAEDLAGYEARRTTYEAIWAAFQAGDWSRTAYTGP